MNKTILIGRLTKDPEIRTGKDDLTIAKWTLAVDRIGSEEADFIFCTAFGKTAEFVEDYITKGQQIAVDGRIQTGRYEKEDGSTAYTFEVIAERVYFADAKRKDEDPAERASYKKPAGQSRRKERR